MTMLRCVLREVDIKLEVALFSTQMTILEGVFLNLNSISAEGCPCPASNVRVELRRAAGRDILYSLTAGRCPGWLYLSRA